MAQLIAERVRVSDLRGSANALPQVAVLEDPTGRRRRRLRLLGRIVAVGLTLWLLALVLGAIGLNPVSGVPFAHVLRPASAPPPARRLPAPAQPSVADLQPALPAGAHSLTNAPQAIPVPGAVRHVRRRAAALKPNGHGQSPRSVAVHTMSPTAQGTPAPSASPKATTHTNNGRGKGVTGTTTTPSGTTTTTGTTTTPGRSGSAPGRTGTTPATSKAGTTTTTG